MGGGPRAACLIHSPRVWSNTVFFLAAGEGDSQSESEETMLVPAAACREHTTSKSPLPQGLCTGCHCCRDHSSSRFHMAPASTSFRSLLRRHRRPEGPLNTHLK